MSLVFLRCILLAGHGAKQGVLGGLAWEGGHAMGLCPRLGVIQPRAGGSSGTKLCRDMFESEHFKYVLKGGDLGGSPSRHVVWDRLGFRVILLFVLPAPASVFMAGCGILALC